jgi:cytochrome c2
MLKLTRVLAVTRRHTVACCLALASVALPPDLAAAVQDPTAAVQDPATRGQQTFQELCAMCHTIGGGVLVGPDLKGVAERRSEEWIISFVQHSQELVKAGDPDAVAIFEEFNLVMPDQPLAEDEILAIIEYTRTAASSGVVSVGVADVPEATEEQILLGQELFQGTTRLASSGPACNACHEVRNDAVIGGGILGPELTTVISRLSARGVTAILRRPPYPVMRRAYLTGPLTEEEITALVGFLQRADRDQALYQPRDYTIKLFFAGLAGTAFLLLMYTLAWRGRSKGSVNKAIFDRQLKST